MSKLFLHLLNISITAGWIVLVVVLLRFVLKKAPKWIRVVLWGLVALRLMLPVSIESVTSLVPSAETVKVESVTYTPPTFQSALPLPAVEGERIVLQSGFSALNSAVNPTPAEAAEHFDTVAVLKTVAGWVWLTGVVGMLLYALISFWRLKHRVRASVALEKGVYVCDEISDPFILGLIVPKIYLPSGMDGQTRGYVLSHERAHLKRFDFIWKPLGFLLLSVYWFNPLLWLAYVLLCRDIELACDEKVIKELDDAGKAAYSEALVHASVSRRMVSACPLAFGETGVKGRVKSVLNYKKPAFWIILVAILCCVAVAVCFLTMPKKEDKLPEEAALPTAAPETVWGSDAKVLQWLDFTNDTYEMMWDSTKKIALDAFPGVTFRWTAGSVEAVENGRTRTLFTGMPVWSVFFADVTNDGKPELCATVSFGSGIVDNHIVVYDYANLQSYTLWDRMQFDFHLYTVNGALYVGKTPYMGDKQVDSGTLTMHDGVPCCLWQSDGSYIPLSRELHESELFGEWLVREERDGEANVTVYTYNLELWKEFDFREDGIVVYNETNPVSSVYEEAFGHPVEYPYAVHDGMVFIGDVSGDGEQWYGTYDRLTDTLTLQHRIAPNQYIDMTLTRMGAPADATSETLDEATLCAIWTLVEIEAPDGSNADPKALQIEQQLDFRSDGTVYVFRRDTHGDTQYVLPYAYDGNAVSFGETTLMYDPQTGQLRCNDPGDGFSVFLFARQASMSLPLLEEPQDLDADMLCTVWTLVEIEAPDGSNGDARALGVEAYLEFRSDETVRMIDRGKEGPATVLSFALDDNTVTVGETVFVYDPAEAMLVCSDFLFDGGNTLYFVRTPDKELPND